MFNQCQREVIWEALLYSEYRYIRKKRELRANEISDVINKIGHFAAVEDVEKRMKAKVDRWKQSLESKSAYVPETEC